MLVVNYTEPDMDFSLLGSFAVVAKGLKWKNKNFYTNQVTIPGISADDAQHLTEIPSLISERVSEFLRNHEQQALLERGAQCCKMCDALFVPSDGKVWEQRGYCSKMCGMRDGLLLAIEVEPSEKRPQESPKVQAVCANGHQFEVLAAFSGCRRPCTECGAKTSIP